MKYLKDNANLSSIRFKLNFYNLCIYYNLYLNMEYLSVIHLSDTAERNIHWLYNNTNNTYICIIHCVALGISIDNSHCRLITRLVNNPEIIMCTVQMWILLWEFILSKLSWYNWYIISMCCWHQLNRIIIVLILPPND